MDEPVKNPNYCPCGSGQDYETCCGIYHAGEQLPPTAEALMRSRFTAYVRDNLSYIQMTWDASTRPAEEKLNFGGEKIEWRTLEVINVKKGTASDNKGMVEFKATYLKDGIEHLLHEVSHFVKSKNRWFYVDGVIKTAGQIVKQSNEGRNAPCPCGSGRKFKRCCASN